MDASESLQQRSQTKSLRSSNEAANAAHTLLGKAVVTSLCLSTEYIVLAMDDGKIHVFDSDGQHQGTLEGHNGGVWATGLWQDTLVSGSVDCHLRVWNMVTRLVKITPSMRTYLMDSTDSVHTYSAVTPLLSDA